MSQQKAAQSGVAFTLQDTGAALANGNVIAIPNSFNRHQIVIKCSAGVASGAIQPETADAADYAGTWAPVGGGAIAVPAASSEVEYNFTGCYKFLRTRISTIVVGGTVTVTYIGSK